MNFYNNSLWYYKQYYADTHDSSINWTDKQSDDNAHAFDWRNKALYSSVFPSEDLWTWSYPETDHQFSLQTTYPGLLLGSGYTHESGLLGEIKLGFYFDYTSGLPVIPGSSVKGVLRSVFPSQYYKWKNPSKEGATSAVEVMQWYLKEYTNTDWSESEIIELENWIFGTFKPSDNEKAINRKCIFHDAVPVDASRVRIGAKQTCTYLASDFITPHKSHKEDIPDALVNPIPIGFVKVLPGVEYRFQFDLQPYLKAGVELVSTQQMLMIFQEILKDYGVGAKSNVGYGQFKTVEPTTLPQKYPIEQERTMVKHTKQKQETVGRPNMRNNQRPERQTIGDKFQNRSNVAPTAQQAAQLQKDEFIAVVKEPKNDKGFKRLAFEEKNVVKLDNINDKSGQLASYQIGTRLVVRVVMQVGSNTTVQDFEIIKTL
jgi:CRISPR-associated protein Cmr6